MEGKVPTLSTLHSWSGASQNAAVVGPAIESCGITERFEFANGRSAIRQAVAVNTDLELAFQLANIADATTLRWWSPDGVASTAKGDGSPVSKADVAAERRCSMPSENHAPVTAFLMKRLVRTRARRGADGSSMGLTGRDPLLLADPNGAR